MRVAPTTPYALQDQDTILDAPVGQYVLRVRDLPNHERPREKMLAAGVASLTQAELVAVLWGVGTRSEEVLTMAKRALREYGEKALLREVKPAHLADLLDIPLTKACQLVAALELGRRSYAVGRGGEPAQVRNPEQAYHYFKAMGNYGKEQLRGLYLGAQYQVVHNEVISIGSLSSNIVHPREVFQPAIMRGAVAILIAHNHPSGSLEPSAADIEVTQQLRAAGKILGIELLDHLIITSDGYKSVIEEDI
ncbi:MAG TPA: DNA repair protein RadC [Candidatus Saccharimonadales bacterium]|nr:DNA repair protein RadC [Candidatus Saccharimonadales bacterium]